MIILKKSSLSDICIFTLLLREMPVVQTATME